MGGAGVGDETGAEADGLGPAAGLDVAGALPVAVALRLGGGTTDPGGAPGPAEPTACQISQPAIVSGASAMTATIRFDRARRRGVGDCSSSYGTPRP
ncbi:hypothetical protein GCM10014713_20000 [Streptomyces purpureus]|uniref:Uncharacterized protein n=1 Tax=Streptomyces purpureus TaxID=1951 RepID=A0A918GZI3_9ACTN|nr:hypothetical protein GCM10014713_20000 [Streptomyces purpureus]